METFPSLVSLLAKRAAMQPDERACIFLGDRGAEEAVLTFRQLHDAAQAFAARLADNARPGDRAILVFPPGLEFLVAFFGCLIARVIAVPMMMPRRQSARDSSAAIIADCEPVVALTSSAFAIRQDLQARFSRQGISWLAVDLAPAAPGAADLPLPGSEDVAFLQYTSGSTSEPKGVAVSHANLLANLEMIRASLGNTGQSTHVNWVPLYHDMGLILNALEALYVGALCVMMAPNAFTQRPLGWLRAISDYRAEVGCSPNFGYDLCVDRYRAEQMQGVDLSSWKVALNGAEPVHAETIARFIETFAGHGFDPTAAFPAYGMAEATLLISGGSRGAGHVTRTVSRSALQAHEVAAPADTADAQTLVGCGRALAGERIAIVEPDDGKRLPAGRVGEVWVNGPNVARAYWKRQEASETDLKARIDGEDDGQPFVEAPFGRNDPQPYIPPTAQPFVPRDNQNYQPREAQPREAQPQEARQPRVQAEPGNVDALPAFITGGAPVPVAPQANGQNGYDNQADRFPLHRRRRRHRGPRDGAPPQGGDGPNDAGGD